MERRCVYEGNKFSHWKYVKVDYTSCQVAAVYFYRKWQEEKLTQERDLV